MIPREMVTCIFLWRLLLYSAPLNILMSHEILPAVAHDDVKDQCYLRLILQLKIAPQLKGLFHAICYLFRKLQFNWTPKIMVQLCYLLPSMARMDWNFKKLRQRLQVLMLSPQNHKNILWLVLSDEICWALPHTSTQEHFVHGKTHKVSS